FTDLLINDRLQRQSGLRMADVYRHIRARHGAAKSQGELWSLYMGIYEALWSLERGSLGGPTSDDRRIGDAWLGARLVRVYARDWLVGGSRFAALLLPYLVEDATGAPIASLLHDTKTAGEGSAPVGVSDIDPGELDDAIHPSQDRAVTGEIEASGPSEPPRE